MLLIYLCILVNFAFVASKEKCCPDIGCFETDGHFDHLPEPTCPEEWGGVKMGLFTRKNRDNPVMLHRSSKIPQEFNGNERTIIIIHGYRNSFKTSFKHAIKDAVLDRVEANVILVCWSGRSKAKWYPNAASATRVVAADVALLAEKLKRHFKKVPFWYCIGFSLGAHTCGFLGKRTKLDGITALDPAGPWFDKYHESTRLNPSSADWVEAIHTDGTGFGIFYGSMVPHGHLDWYVNGGGNQPGCWTLHHNQAMQNSTTFYEAEISGNMDAFLNPEFSKLACSHSRAFQYFIEGLKEPGCHVAHKRCIINEKFDTLENCLNCKPGKINCPIMGLPNPHYKGVYYMETKAASPHCLYDEPWKWND